MPSSAIQSTRTRLAEVAADFRPARLPSTLGDRGGLGCDPRHADHLDRSVRLQGGPGLRVPAATDAVVAEIDQRRFVMVVKSSPFFAIETMKLLADRLRRRS